MKRITIKIPKNEKEKWEISLGHGLRRRNSAMVVFMVLKRHLQARATKEKTKIIIKMGNQVENESLPSTDAQYLIYTASCFLENYLSDKVLADAVRDWISHGN